MKNLFKSLLVCGLVAFVGSLITSCEQDPFGGGGEETKPSVFEITGEPVVHTGISVEVPVKIENLHKLVCYTREICEDENGDKYFVAGYDSNNQPVKGALVSTPSATVIQRNGSEKACVDGQTIIHFTGNDGLDKNKMFIVYILAFVTEDKPYNNREIFSVEFATPNTYGEGDIHIIRTNYEGCTVSVTMPEQVKAAGRKLKWGIIDIAMWAYQGSNKPIPEILHHHDAVYPAFNIQNDTIIEINHYNAYRRNKSGDIGYYIISNSDVREVSPTDPAVEGGSATPIQYYPLPMPGAPLVLIMSEIDYATCSLGDYEEGEDADHKIATCDKKHPMIDWGWGTGWYWYPYDYNAYIKALRGGDDDLPNMGVGPSTGPTIDPDKFWHEGAWYYKKEFRLPEPKKFNGSVSVQFDNLSTQDGRITLTPDGETYMYLLGIFETTNDYQQGYIDLTRTYLNGDASLWQWFVTSEIGLNFMSQHLGTEGTKTINLSDYLVELRAGMLYHVLVTAVGKTLNKNGDYEPDYTAQNFQHLTFRLKDYTLPEPVLDVTAAEAYSPWKVKYILKNPDWKNNPISKVTYVCNYTREFDAYMKANDMTYTDMAMLNAGINDYMLDEADIEKINSPAGAEIEFDVLEKSSFTAAFIGWNSEGRATNPDNTEHPGYATAESLAVSPATPLDMTKLNALKGDWTATATVNYIDSDTQEFTAQQHSWKVSIGDLTCPDALSQDIYDIFAGAQVSKEQADAYFAEFKQEQTAYNEAVKGQNRVLCQGWQLDSERVLSTASPWDLFTMTDYHASTTNYLFYDFGPKWFLQVNADGEVFVPVNYNRIPPFTSWYNGMAHYLCMANYEMKYAYIVGNDINSVEQVAIPVEISEDGNTFTLKSTTMKFYDVDENNKPITDESGNIITYEVPFYPNVLYEGTTGLTFYNNHIISEVVLTRGWNGSATPTPSKASVKGVSGPQVKTKNQVAPSTFKKAYGITALVPKPVKVENNVAKQSTPEEINKRIAELFNKRQPATRK